MIAMLMQFALAVDMTVGPDKVSEYVLNCGRMAFGTLVQHRSRSRGLNLELLDLRIESRACGLQFNGYVFSDVASMIVKVYSSNDYNTIRNGHEDLNAARTAKAAAVVSKSHGLVDLAVMCFACEAAEGSWRRLALPAWPSLRATKPLLHSARLSSRLLRKLRVPCWDDTGCR